MFVGANIYLFVLPLWQLFASREYLPEYLCTYVYILPSLVLKATYWYHSLNRKATHTNLGKVWRTSNRTRRHYRRIYNIQLLFEKLPVSVQFLFAWTLMVRPVLSTRTEINQRKKRSLIKTSLIAVYFTHLNVTIRPPVQYCYKKAVSITTRKYPWRSGKRDGLRYRSKCVRTPVTILRSLWV